MSCAAPNYAIASGWSIIPTGRDKKPLITTWKPFQTRLPTDEELTAWARLNPAAWALVTGALSKRITLDFDGAAGAETMQRLTLSPHRRTPSGGYHVDFVHPGWHVPTLNSKSKRELGERWPGLNIGADGGYVVIAGRTDRGEHAWLRDVKPYELDILPDDLRDFLGLLHAPLPEEETENSNKPALESGRVNPERLIGKALDRAASEGRNNAGFWLAGQCRDNGYRMGEAEAAMRSYRNRCPATNIKGARAAPGKA